MKRIVFLLITCTVASVSNPLFNINSENDHIYFLREASTYISNDITSMKPLNISRSFGFTEKVERLRPYIYIEPETSIYIKPLNEIEILALSTNEERGFIEGSSGISLEKGFNLYLFNDGFMSLGERSIIYYQLRYRNSNNINDLSINRLYGKFRVGKISFSVGKDNVNLGPGEYGMLLSNNVEPFPLLKLQTEQSLNAFGEWDFIFLRGWLIEERKDRDNPSILALRLIWKPVKALELGATKTTLYEGEGRPKYKIEEYLELILSTRDNIPGDRYDNSSNASYDISLYLPLNNYIPSVKVFKIYFQEAASDVIAFWQVEDKGTFYPPFGIRFLQPAYQFGFLLSTNNDIVRLEVAKISNKFFVHHYYPVEGHSYKGLSLGYPYGRNSLSAFLKHRHYFSNELYFEYKIGGYKKPFEGYQIATERYFIQLLTSYTINRVRTTIFIRGDKVNNYDKEPLPHIFNITKEEKLFYTLGIGFTMII